MKLCVAFADHQFRKDAGLVGELGSQKQIEIARIEIAGAEPGTNPNAANSGVG